MTRRRSLLAALAAPPVRDQLLGVWNLVSYARRGANGKVDYPYSERPVGRITYDSAGRMSAQLMRPGRRSTLASGVSFATGRAADAEIREAVAGFIAYYGTFTVDERVGEVIHHVEACLVPSWVGTDLRRKYRFTGDHLTLTAVAGDFSVELVWRREKP
ncbi:MAG: lipocalin-like domain-containing protein [Bryobacteraceae bacterium]|nr:lipocalin-like domain-containing protein [Bryobacteraceae bacterium]